MKHTSLEWVFDKISSHFTHDGDLFESVSICFSIAKLSEKEKMKQLRKKFFNECVENGKVNYAPHDLFEWFVKNL